MALIRVIKLAIHPEEGQPRFVQAFNGVGFGNRFQIVLRRYKWPPFQGHARLFRGFIGLFNITLPAGSNSIQPVQVATAAFWVNMIKGKVYPFPKPMDLPLSATVLAAETISKVKVKAVKGWLR